MFATSNGLDCLSFLAGAVPLTGVIGLSANRSRDAVSGYVNIEERLQGSGLDLIAVDDYQLMNADARGAISARDIDLLLVLGWQRLIPEWLISHCRIGAIGNHGSADGIAGGRGRSPQNWALLTGRNAFEVSIFWIEPGIDSGAVIDTRRFPLEAYDDIRSSHYKTAYYVADMLRETWRDGRLQARAGTPQDETDAAYLPQRRPEDGAIDWTRSAGDIHDFVRALTRPYPGAFSAISGTQVQLWRVRPFLNRVGDPDEQPAPGEILAVLSHGELIVQTGAGTLMIDEWSAADPGLQPVVGERFASVDFTAQMRRIAERHRTKYPDLPIAEAIARRAGIGA